CTEVGLLKVIHRINHQDRMRVIRSHFYLDWYYFNYLDTQAQEKGNDDQRQNQTINKHL
ncbi:hypothetical protein HNR62_002853, partial [Oceanisphaera litoralis]|nr:hypothetical protein [Oceanisphaera litoralis]